MHHMRKVVFFENISTILFHTKYEYDPSVYTQYTQSASNVHDFCSCFKLSHLFHHNLPNLKNVKKQIINTS